MYHKNPSTVTGKDATVYINEGAGTVRIHHAAELTDRRMLMQLHAEAMVNGRSASDANDAFDAVKEKLASLDFAMTDQPEPAARIAVLFVGDRSFRAEWRLDGDIEGGTFLMDPRDVPEDWSRGQVRAEIWSAMTRGCISLAGVPADIRRAAQAGDIVMGAM